MDRPSLSVLTANGKCENSSLLTLIIHRVFLCEYFSVVLLNFEPILRSAVNFESSACLLVFVLVFFFSLFYFALFCFLFFLYKFTFFAFRLRIFDWKC